MKAFLLKVFAFALPIIVLFSAPLYVLISSGESMKNLDDALHGTRRYLIGYAYNEKNYGYIKWKTITEKKRQEIVAVGSSRVLQFRNHMFKAPFYNAGYVVKSLNDFLPFLESIPKEKYPGYLIIGLDQWMFNKNRDNLKQKPDKEKWRKSFTFFPSKETIALALKDLIFHKYNISNLKPKDTIERIGLNAVVNGKGFRNDGSMLYATEIHKLLSHDTLLSSYRSRQTLCMIKNGSGGFVYAQKINDNALHVLDTLLNFCKKSNIKVIGFLPPFSNTANHLLASTHRHQYLSKIYPRALKVFKKYGFEFYDFSLLSACHSNDDEFIDDFHGGELTYLKILITMLKHGSILNKVATLRKLERDLKKPFNSYIVYKQW